MKIKMNKAQIIQKNQIQQIVMKRRIKILYK